MTNVCKFNNTEPTAAEPSHAQTAWFLASVRMQVTSAGGQEPVLRPLLAQEIKRASDWQLACGEHFWPSADGAGFYFASEECLHLAEHGLTARGLI